MPIVLNLHSESQVILFQDPIIAEELSSLRLKLDQKILQGQSHIVFDLSQIDLEKNKLVSKIFELMDFCAARKVNLAAVHPNKTLWKKISTPAKSKIEKYIQLDEAIKPIQTPTDIQSQLDGLEKLIAEYQKKSVDKSYDPIRLMHTLKLYKQSPTKDHLKALERGVLEYKKIRSENASLNQYVSELADEVSQLTALRKSFIHPEETKYRKKALIVLSKLFEVENELIKINFDN